MNPEEAIRSFESYLAQIMVKEMRATLPDGGLLSNQAAEMFMGVFDQEVAERIAAGPGLGLRQALGGAMGDRAGSMAPLLLPEAPGHRQWPARPPVEGVITSQYGRREDPFHHDERMHSGVDIAADHGSPIRSVRDGEVLFAGRRGGYGNVVIVDHGEGLQTLYAHCESLNVRAGQRVKAGSVVGAVGSTGRSTGAHLHFEVRVDGETVDPDETLRWR